jgi:hypothetical protein
VGFEGTEGLDHFLSDDLDLLPKVHHLHAFRLAIDAAVERVQGFEDIHRPAGGHLGFYPLIPQEHPTF